MKKILLALALVLTAGVAKADVSYVYNIEAAIVAQTFAGGGLDWKIGDIASYTLDMGFLKGTMVMKVTKLDPQGFWMEQAIDVQVQKQTAEILIDKNNGQILKMIVDGKEQAPPKSDLEVLETKQATIKVPAGDFQAIYLKVKDKANKDAITELWVNPKLVPMSGMLKTLADSQFGKVTVELTSYTKTP